MRRVLILILLGVASLFLLVPRTARAQGGAPVDHTDMMSGGSTDPDLDSTSPGPGSPTGTKRPPRVGPNVQANAPQQAFPNGLLGRSETTVASTDDGQLILVGFNDAQGFCGPPFGVTCTPETPPGLSGYAFSTDAGVSFTDGGAPDPTVFNNVFTRGDPWMDRGGSDLLTFYYANLAVDATSGAALGASVHRGHFNGSTFNFEDVRVLGPTNPNDSFDKEAIAASKDGTAAVYLTITNFKEVCNISGAGFGEITVFNSHDGGNTWSSAVVAGPDQTFITDPNSPLCGTSGNLQQSSNPAIGPNGELYVAWQLGPTLSAFAAPSANASIVVARSLDGGATFGSPVTVANVNSLRQDPPVGYNRSRINDHPRVAVATSGSHVGRVYVTFYSAVNPVGTTTVIPCPTGVSGTCVAQNVISSQVFLSFSDDKGLTWSTPAAIAPAVPATGVKRWWPVVAVEPGGTVDMVYYESQETFVGDTACNRALGGGLRRVGPNVSLVDTFWVESTDGGTTFGTPIKMTTATSNWCTAVSNVRPNFGDYIGTTFGGNHVLATWGDGRNGVPDTFFATGLGAGKSK